MSWCLGGALSCGLIADDQPEALPGQVPPAKGLWSLRPIHPLGSHVSPPRASVSPAGLHMRSDPVQATCGSPFPKAPSVEPTAVSQARSLGNCRPLRPLGSPQSHRAACGGEGHAGPGAGSRSGPGGQLCGWKSLAPSCLPTASRGRSHTRPLAGHLGAGPASAGPEAGWGVVGRPGRSLPHSPALTPVQPGRGQGRGPDGVSTPPDAPA